MTTGFENCVVLKPWGFEFQVFDNGRASVWMLCIKPGQGTSVHCHFGKSARFVPLAGTVVVRTNEEVRSLTFPHSAEVQRYEFHAVGNPGAEDLWLIEIESPSNKDDLFRLRDKYGRGQGYERGGSIQRIHLVDFRHFQLSDGGPAIHFARHAISVSEGRLLIAGEDGPAWHPTAWHLLFDPQSATEAA